MREKKRSDFGDSPLRGQSPSVNFEDQYLLIIDKQAGIVVNRSQNAPKNTIQDWAEEKLKIKNKKAKLEGSDFYGRAGIVHRLDKETSGILLIAKNEDIFKKLQEQFKSRTIKKTYLVLVHGKLTPIKMTIKLPIGRLPWNRRKFGVIPDGRQAETKIKVRQYYKRKGGENYTFIEAKPVTGRTHQIRVHLKQAGFPVVGDTLYSGRKTLKADNTFCPRLFLHHSRLEFVHPVSGEEKTAESELPEELKQVLTGLLYNN